jgi:hypothetical protein
VHAFAVGDQVRALRTGDAAETHQRKVRGEGQTVLYVAKTLVIHGKLPQNLKEILPFHAQKRRELHDSHAELSKTASEKL